MAYSLNILSMLSVSQRKITSTPALLPTAISTPSLTTQLYAIVQRPTDLTPLVLDVTAMLRTSPNYASGLTYQQLIMNTIISDLSFARYQTSLVPLPDPTTGAYLNRCAVIDAMATSGWSVGYGNVDQPTDLNDLNTRGTSNDLVITPPTGTTLTNLLVAVNGVFHNTTVYNGMVFVIDGYENIRQSGQQDVVVVDTTGVGGHTIVPITTSMVTSTPSTITTQARVTLPNTVNLTQQPVLLCCDGYLHVFDSAYQPFNTTTLQINTSKIDLIGCFIDNPNQRYTTDIFGTRTRTNPYTNIAYPVVSALHASDETDADLSTFVSTNSVPASQLQAPAFWLRRLTSLHSFVVVFNQPNIFTTQYTLRPSDTPQAYEIISNDTPRGMLFYGIGKVLPYTILCSQFYFDQIVLSHSESTIGEWRTNPNPACYPSAQSDAVDPTLQQRAYLLELFST